MSEKLGESSRDLSFFDYPYRKFRRQVRLAVCNLRGERVAALLDAELPAGVQIAVWGGTSDRGVSVPSGVYSARLKTSAGVRTVTLTLAR